MFRRRILVLNAILLLALLGNYWGRRIEGASVAHTDFLRPLSLPFRGWKTADAALSKGDLALLQPDATLVRRYRGPDDQSVELAVIAGHRKRTVHTPGYCMVGGGWEVVEQKGCELRMDGRIVPANRSVMSNQGHQMVVTYFFTDGEYATRSVVQLQGVQLLGRLRAQVPLGALVRLIVPVTRDRADAERLSDEFAAAVVPPVLASLRSARLPM